MKPVAVLLWAVTLCFFDCAHVRAGLKIVFGEHAELSDSDVEVVLKLAHKAGLTNVAEIQSYASPTVKLGIIAKSEETINGREISIVSVDVQSGGVPEFISKSDRDKIWASDGQFWVQRGDIHTNKFTICHVKGRSVRVRNDQNVSVKEIDRVVAALGAAQVRYASDAVKEQVAKVDISKSDPVSIGLGEGGKIVISFSGGDFSWVILTCVLDDKGILVLRAFRAIE
jgi:hypothetical protein